MIKPTMSQAANKEELNELLVKYYEELISKYDKNLGSVYIALKQNRVDDAINECDDFIDSLN